MFVKTPDFEETINGLKQLFRMFKKPVYMLKVIGLGIFCIYMMFAVIILLG